MDSNITVQVSIIIPVFNTEKYLERCLDSVRRQTFKNIEVICIDDGSTDKSLAILEAFAKRDCRFKILKQNNKGGGAARNLGLQQALGEYVIFWDSDDFFHPEFIEVVYYQAVLKAADIVITGGKVFDCSTGNFIVQRDFLRRDFFYGKRVIAAEEISGDIARITNSAPWNKLFRKKFILENDLYFQEISNSNDVFFCLMALFLAKRISYVDMNLVYYRINHGGNIQSKKSKEPLAFFRAYMAVRDELIKRNLYEVFEQAWVNVTVVGFWFNLNSMPGSEERNMIYDALVDEEFIKTGVLDHPSEYYYDSECVDNIKGFLSANSFKKKQCISKLHEVIILPSEYKKHFPDISVIIPIYNVENYLEMTLNSIISQSYKNIEIICINDGSTDGSLKVLEKLARKDSRISVYTQQNEGLSATRNWGVEVSRGKYVYFMDSDDLLNQFALEILYKRAEENELDVIYFDGDSFADKEEDTELIKKYDGYYVRKNNYPQCTSGIQMFKLLMKNKEYRSSACLQMIRRKYLSEKGIKFHEGIIYEDNIFSLEAMITAEKAGYCGLELFYRRVRKNSIMTQKTVFYNAYSYFRCYLDTLEITKNIELDYETANFIENLLYGYKQRVKNMYNELETWEKKTVNGLPLKEKVLFLELCEA